MTRVGQINLTEIDPEVCDIGFWPEYWKKSETLGIILNAGGIVAYYPSKFELHYRAARLGNRDFFGEFVSEARKAGLIVLARMDCNRVTEDFYKAKPGWFARHKDNTPYITQGRYQTCVSSGYYKEYIPGVLREIIEHYHPDGFTDNSWRGIGRQSICYCENCKREFREYSGESLPEEADFRDPVYRKWISWGYKRAFAFVSGEYCRWYGFRSGWL